MNSLVIGIVVTASLLLIGALWTTSLTINTVAQLAFLLGFPVVLVLVTYRTQKGFGDARRAYKAARVEGLTPGQLEAYQNDIGFIGRHYKGIAIVALLVLAIVMPYLSAPLFIIYCARAWRAVRQTKEEVDADRRVVRS